MRTQLVKATERAAEPSGPPPLARLPLPTFVKFVIVGGFAFLVNEAALYVFYESPLAWFLPDRHGGLDFLLFTHPDARLLIASIIAVELAIVFKFFLHERWTFRDYPRHYWMGSRFARFNVSALVSSVISVAAVNVLTPVFEFSPYLANGIGVFAGFVSNWAFSIYLVWPHKQAPAHPDEVRA